MILQSFESHPRTEVKFLSVMLFAKGFVASLTLISIEFHKSLRAGAERIIILVLQIDAAVPGDEPSSVQGSHLSADSPTGTGALNYRKRRLIISELHIGIFKMKLMLKQYERNVSREFKTVYPSGDKVTAVLPV